MISMFKPCLLIWFLKKISVKYKKNFFKEILLKLSSGTNVSVAIQKEDCAKNFIK